MGFPTTNVSAIALVWYIYLRSGTKYMQWSVMIYICHVFKALSFSESIYIYHWKSRNWLFKYKKALVNLRPVVVTFKFFKMIQSVCKHLSCFQSRARLCPSLLTSQTTWPLVTPWRPGARQVTQPEVKHFSLTTATLNPRRHGLKERTYVTAMQPWCLGLK